MYKKKKCSKKSILHTCGHRLGQKDFSSPKSEQRRVKDTTSDRALASRAHSEVPTFLFLFYFLGLLAFVRFSLSSLICSSARPLTVYSFYSGVHKQISKTKELNHVGKLKKNKKKIKKRTNASIFKKKCNTSQNEDFIVLLSELWD